jgi:hypothetical protein
MIASPSRMRGRTSRLSSSLANRISVAPTIAVVITACVDQPAW